MNDASEIVNYAKLQPSFRQISQPKYLAATTTRRVYHNITKVEVEAPEIKEVLRKRKVETLDGKQSDLNKPIKVLKTLFFVIFQVSVSTSRLLELGNPISC